LAGPGLESQVRLVQLRTLALFHGKLGCTSVGNRDREDDKEVTLLSLSFPSVE
jgi:hypothetical protein